MGPGHHATHDQLACPALPLSIPQLRSQHHRLYCCRACSHDPAHGSTDQSNEEAASFAASHEGDTGQVPRQKRRREPSRAIQRIHGALPRSRRQPHRMPRPDGYSDAHLDRVLPRNHSNHAHHTRGHGKSLCVLLRMEPGRRRCATQPTVPRHRPRRHCVTGLPPPQFRPPCSRRRIHVHHHKDDHHHRHGRASTIAATNHAMDDAGDDRRLHIPISCRSRHLHIAIQHRRRSHPILRRRQTANRAVRKTLPRNRRNASSSDSSQRRASDKNADRR